MSPERATSTAVVPLWAAVLVALAAGPVLDAGFPDRNLWPLTFVGIALVLVALIGRRAWSAALVGFVAGCSFYFLHIEWAQLFLGPLPWAALSVLESLFVALGSAAIAFAYRWIPSAWPTILGRLVLLPVVVAGLWTAREAWAAVWPYGGFAWGRVALSQSESPVAPLFAWLGISGVSFAMVLVAAIAVQAFREPGIGSLARATLVVAAATAIVAGPTWPAVTDGSIRVAAVQGNAKAGYFDRREVGENLADQVSATLPLAGEELDVVVWPEGGTDVDPLRSAYAAQVFDTISRELGAPLVSGAITERDGRYYNTSLLWRDGEGAVDYYDKRHPVPFGEYVPDRDFWEPFAPDLIGLIAREYTPGTTDALFDLDGVVAGVNICFDIVDDELMTEMVADGANVVFAQSNNADFGRTDESVQQLAIARIRAIELGRSVVNISTVGTSAIIAPDGSTIDQLEWYTADAMVSDVPTASLVTPAVVLGREIEWFVSLLSLSALGFAGIRHRQERHG